MASLNELTHGVGHPLLGEATPYFVNILVRGAPRWDADRLSADLRAEFQQVRASHFEGALVLNVDGSPPFAIARGELPPPDTFDQALRDTVWPGARSAVARAKHAVSVMDAPGSPPRERLDRFERIVRVLLRRHVDAVAVHWAPSECIVDPIAFAKNEPHVLMQGAVNVRLFRGVDEAGDPVALHMDTLGLGAFGLPDLECRFLDLDPNLVGERLYLYADYLIDKGDVLAEGHTVDGVDGRWLCRRSVARAAPARRVVLFDPGIAQQPVPRVRGVRCPACGGRPDANARWECHCGFWWNTFDTAAVCVVDLAFLAHLLQLALPVLLAAAASVFELRTGNIPNALTLGAGALGIALVVALDRDLGMHSGGFFLGALVFLAIYRTDYLGGGSVKLGIAITAIVGWFMGALFIAGFGVFFGAAYVVRRALRRPDTVVPGAPVLLTALLCAEAAAPFLWPLL